MNFFKNICCAIWNCVKGIAGGLWSIFKGMFKIFGSIIDFLEDVLDSLFDLIADGIACLILIFIPSEEETVTDDNPLVSGFQEMIDNGQINFDDGISIAEIKKKVNRNNLLFSVAFQLPIFIEKHLSFTKSL